MTKTRSVERQSATRILYLFILASFVFALIYVPLRTLIDEGYRAETEYKIIIFQLAMGVVFLRLPYFLSRVFRIRIASGLSAAYMLFLWCALFLGEFALFYYRVPVWDSLLHVFSAALTTLAVLSLPSLLGESAHPLLCALLAVGASITLGVAWEIYEFTFDGILGLNMQKFATPAGINSVVEADGIKGLYDAISKGGAFAAEAGRLFNTTASSGELAPLVGRAALVDTMTDLILDLLGSVTVAIWGYIYINRNGKLPKCVQITRKTPHLT